MATMRNFGLAFCLGLAIGFGAELVPNALAQSAGSLATPFPGGAYGNIALDGGAAVQVPATPTNGRYALSIQNLSAAKVYCGFDSSVTTSTGTQIPASGGQGNFNVGYTTQTGQAALWCVSDAAQTSPNDTRWMEVK